MASTSGRPGENSVNAGEPQNRIVHQEFTITEAKDGVATIGTRNKWISKDDNTICNDQRVIRFGAEDDARWIDFTTNAHCLPGRRRLRRYERGDLRPCALPAQ